MHCAIGHHSSCSPLPGVALGNTANVRIRCVDTLLDVGVLTGVVQSSWHGERNLYCFGGRQWPAILAAKDTYKPIFSFADWQQHWKSDADSRAKTTRFSSARSFGLKSILLPNHDNCISGCECVIA